jgi:DNA invertase Pin-like site-specific DNA recombinase
MAAAQRGRPGGADMKAAAYLRVSSNDQTTDNQLPAIEAYAASRGYELVEIYRGE